MHRKRHIIDMEAWQYGNALFTITSSAITVIMKKYRNTSARIQSNGNMIAFIQKIKTDVFLFGSNINFQHEDKGVSHKRNAFVFVIYSSKHSANRESALIRSFKSSVKTPSQFCVQKCLGNEGKFSLGKTTLDTNGAVYWYSPWFLIDSYTFLCSKPFLKYSKA